MNDTTRQSMLGMVQPVRIWRGVNRGRWGWAICWADQLHHSALTFATEEDARSDGNAYLAQFNMAAA